MQDVGQTFNQFVSIMASSARAEAIFINTTEWKSQILFETGKHAYSVNKTSRD